MNADAVHVAIRRREEGSGRGKREFDESSFAADGDGAASFEDAQHLSFRQRAPCRLPVFESADHPSDGGVVRTNFDAESALTDGVKERGTGERRGDTVGHVEADEAGRGEDEGGEGSFRVVELRQAGITVRV